MKVNSRFLPYLKAGSTTRRAADVTSTTTKIYRPLAQLPHHGGLHPAPMASRLWKPRMRHGQSPSRRSSRLPYHSSLLCLKRTCHLLLPVVHQTLASWPTEAMRMQKRTANSTVGYRMVLKIIVTKTIGIVSKKVISKAMDKSQTTEVMRVHGNSNPQAAKRRAKKQKGPNRRRREKSCLPMRLSVREADGTTRLLWIRLIPSSLAFDSENAGPRT